MYNNVYIIYKKFEKYAIFPIYNIHIYIDI